MWETIQKKRLLFWGHCAVLVYAAVMLFLRSFFQFNSGGDYLWYHLPNGLIRWNYTDFVPSGYIQLINETLPPLGDWVQGMLVALTGSVKAATGANFLAFGLVFFLTWRLYRERFQARYFLTGVLAIPLFLHHMSSGYVDLFGASGVFLSFVSLKFLKDSTQFRFAAFTFCLGIFIATLSRFQTWPAATLLWALAAYQVLWANKTLRMQSRIFFIVASLLVLALWPARNFIKYGNPTYPYKAPFIGKYFPHAITMEELHVNQVPKRLIDKPQPWIFFNSVFEVSRFTHPSVKYKWNTDQGFYGGVESPHFRMGGWSVFTLLLLLSFFFWGLWRRLHDPVELIFLGGITLFTSFMSQGHELRYSIFIPLALLFMVAQSMKFFSPKWVAVFGVLLLSSAVDVSNKYHIERLDLTPFTEHVPERIKKAWEAYEESDRTRPLCGEDNADSIFYTGPTLSEYPVVDADKSRCKNGFYH